MARKRFPLVDVLLGVPSTGARLGAAALLTHGLVIELYEDAACTAPLDALDTAGNPITSVTVDGVTIPPFDGPDDGRTLVYGRRAGATGNGFPLAALDYAAPPGAPDPADTGAYLLNTGHRVPILDAANLLPMSRIAELEGTLNGLTDQTNGQPRDHWYDYQANAWPERPSTDPNKPLRWIGPAGSHPAVGEPPSTTTMYARDHGIELGAVTVTPPPPPPTGGAARFPGDPGAGNYYVGGRPDQQSFPVRATAITTWQDRMEPWAGATKKKLSIERIYDTDAHTTSGLNSGPRSEVTAAHAAGRLPHISFKLPKNGGTTQLVTPDDAANQTGQFATWMDNLAAWFNGLGGKPVWWTFWHEPENDAGTWGNPDGSQPTLSKKYRDACRNIAKALKARGVTNAAFVTTCWMTPYSFGKEYAAAPDGSGARDWRIYYPDWKGTTASGSSKNAPNPTDFYVKGSSTEAVVDALGIDVYNWWDTEGKTKDKFVTFWDLFRHAYERTSFTGLPYVQGEFGVMVYHTGSVDAGTAGNWDYAMTRSHLSAMFDVMAQYDVIACEVFNYSITRPHWRLELADPAQSRYEGYGRGMARANHVYPTI